MIFQKSKQIYRDKQNQKPEKKQRNAGEKKVLVGSISFLLLLFLHNNP